MKPVFEKLSDTSKLPIKVFHFKCNHFSSPWHFHDEYELVMVCKSKGKRFVGNDIANFNNEDLVLLGPSLPHVYLNSSEYYKNKKSLEAESIVIHFSKDFLSKEYSESTEMKELNILLKRSSQGIEFYGSIIKTIGQKMKMILKKKGLEKLTIFLSILNLLALSKKYKLLSSKDFIGINQEDNDRMDLIIKYIMNNYYRQITLKDISKYTNMSVSAFCNFFKTRTQKTFIHYLNEVRIATACKLLIEDELNISQICYDSGFSSIRNFNKQFKIFMNENPAKYKKTLISRLSLQTLGYRTT